MRYAEACQVLGVSPGASATEIKKAYRQRVRECHPDTNAAPDAVDRFRAVQEAHEVLTSAVTDMLAVEAQVSDVVPARWPDGRSERAVPLDGLDVTGNLVLTLQEAFHGTTTDIEFDDHQPCERCSASGAEPGSAWMACPSCAGLPTATCRWCGGDGRVPAEPCRQCNASGVETDTRNVRVAVPRSATDGQTLRVAGRGKWGARKRGDLLLSIKVEEPENMRRVGDHLEVDVPIDVVSAVLGGTASVPSVEGTRYTIAIPPGTPSAKQFRIRGGGMYCDRDSDDRGDLLAVIHIVVPSPGMMAPEELELWEQLKQLRDGASGS